jgi:hypothetical protein
VLGRTLFLKISIIPIFCLLEKINVRKGVIRGHILKITIYVAGTRSSNVLG